LLSFASLLLNNYETKKKKKKKKKKEEEDGWMSGRKLQQAKQMLCEA